MKEQSKIRKRFTDFFVLRPLGFVIYLLLGAVVFIFVSANMKIPVYTTVESYVEKEDDRIRLILHDQKFQMDAPIFLYRSRDDSLKKITVYQIRDGYIVTEDTGVFSNGEKVSMDLQIKEVTLLRHIFMEGGNT